MARASGERKDRRFIGATLATNRLITQAATVSTTLAATTVHPEM